MPQEWKSVQVSNGAGRGTDMKNVEQLGGNSNIFYFHP